MPVPAQLVPFAFNSVTAALAGRKSAEIRARSVEPVIQALPTLPNDEAEPAHAVELAIVEDQIKRAVNVLNDERFDWCPACERAGLQPHHRAQLLKALDALLDRKRVLAGIPLPGSRRPRPEPSGRRQALPAYDPTPIAPAIPQEPQIVASAPQPVAVPPLVASPPATQDAKP